MDVDSYSVYFFQSFPIKAPFNHFIYVVSIHKKWHLKALCKADRSSSCAEVCNQVSPIREIFLFCFSLISSQVEAAIALKIPSKKIPQITLQQSLLWGKHAATVGSRFHSVVYFTAMVNMHVAIP